MATLDASLRDIGQKRRSLSRPRGWRRVTCLDWKSWARTIVSIRATPRQVALGVALGSFIAFSPLIGLQTLLAALFATLIGASKKAAMLAVWISNPLTMGPIFAVTYQLGLILGSPEPAAASTTGPVLAAAETPMATLATNPYGFEWLLHAGWGYILPMLLGGAAVGLVAAFLAYRLTHRGVLAYQVALARRQRARANP